MLFQRLVKNASFVLRWPGVGFHAHARGALKQTDTKTCHVSVTAQHSFPLVENYAPWNMSSKLEPQNLPPTETCQSFGKRSSARLDAEVAQAPQTYPTETCNLSGVMFQPHPPIFHVPHAIFIHAPWPIHDVLDLFSTSHCYRIVFLPNSNIFINTPY
jgi:hypothetical protein